MVIHSEQDPVSVCAHNVMEGMTPVLRRFNDLILVEMTGHAHKNLGIDVLCHGKTCNYGKSTE